MKKYYLYLLLGVFCSFNLFSQKTKDGVYIIDIDFKDKTITSIPKKINKGDFYRLHIKKINLNKWKINNSSVNSVVTKALKTPSFDDIGLTSLSTLTSSFISSLSSQPEISIDSLLVTEPDNNKSIEIETISPCDNLAKELINSQTVLNLLVSTELAEVKKKYEMLGYRFSMYKYELLKELPEKQTHYTPEKILTDIKEMRLGVNESEEIINESKVHYVEILESKDNQTCFKDNEKIKKLKLENDKLYVSYTKAINEFRENINPLKIDSIIQSVMFLKNGVNEFTTFPIQFTEEKSEVSVVFTPKEDKFNEFEQKIKFNFPIDKGETYWSLGASFFASNLSNERFSVTSSMDNDSTTVYSVVEEIKDKHELGVASLLRFGKKLKINNKIGYHGSFGVGANIGKNIRPRLLFGGGFSFGKKHSLALDLGLIAGYVNVKSNAVDLSAEYAIKPEETVVTKLKGGGFLSLGYLFKL